jgi:hypothetical protein
VIVTNYLHRPLFPLLIDCIADGGALIYETFARGNERFGRPSNPAFLARAGRAAARRGRALAGARLRGSVGRSAQAGHGAADLCGALDLSAVPAATALPICAKLSAALGRDRGRFGGDMLKGSLVAIVSPMFEDGSLDLDALRRLIDWHVAEGTDGIVVVGTTGESPTVDFDEHCQLIRSTVQHTAGRVPVIAGTGANSTSEAIELQAFAKRAGADLCLSVVPYYNKPTQEGLYRHFKAIAEAVDIPTLMYNVPGRTVCDMQNDTVVRLAQVPNIVGIKDATANLERGA